MIDFQNPGPPQEPGKPPLSPEEFRRQARAVQDEQPSAFEPLVLDEAVEGPKPKTRVRDALGRGMVEGANQASDAVVGLGGFLTKHAVPALLDHYAPGFTQSKQYKNWHEDFLDWYDAGRTSEINPLKVGEPTLDKMFGKPQHGLGGFIEGVGQVATGMIATGGLAMEAKAAQFLVQGALIDGAFFDPYQKRIANWIEDKNLPIASDLAKFIAADPNDNEAVARFKAVLEGVMAGKLVGSTLHALNAARLQGAAKLGRFAGGTKEAAEKAIEGELKLSAEAVDNPKDALEVITHDDGTASAVPSPYTGRELPPHPQGKIPDEVIADPDKWYEVDGSGVWLELKEPFKPIEIRSAAWQDARGNVYEGINHADAAEKAGAAGANIESLVSDGFVTKDGQFVTRDEALKRGGPSMSPKDGWKPVEGAAAPEALHFETAGEAHNFVASVNEAVKSAELPPINVSPETLSLFRARVGQITEAHSLEEIDQMLSGWGTDFNFSRVSAPAEVKLQIEALSRELPSITEMARALGTQPHEVTTKLAQQLNRHLDAGQAVAMAKKLYGETKDLPQRLLATRAWLFAKGAEVSRLSKIVDSAGDNAVAMQELTKTLDQLWDFHSAAAGTASNVGRGLDAMKIDPTPLAKQVEAQGAEAVGDQVAKQASDVIDAKVTGKTLTQINEEAAAKAEGNGAPPKPEAAPAQATPEEGALAQTAADAEAKQAAGEPLSPTEQVAVKAPKAKTNGKAPGDRLSGGLTKRELRGLARQIRLAEGNPDQILDAMYAVRATKVAAGDPTLMQRIIGFRMNAMLSGPKTLVINASSNAMAAVQRPVEFWYAGVRSGNKELRSMGSDMLVGLATEFGESFRAGWKSLVTGENLLDRSKMAFEDSTQESATLAGKTWLQTTLNVPSRVLMSTDEFFKQLNYRTNVRAQAFRDARQLGLTEARDIAEHVESTMESAFALGTDRSATNPVALEYARVSTFTNDLGEGTIGKWIQDGAIKHPALRLIMPFVRTPVNLFRWTWERTPGLARFSNGYAEAMKAGGERAAVASAKVELGTAVYSMAAFYAVSGNVTGAGPSSPELRKQWLQAGNQPYSVKVPGTDKWISYRRADPVITPVGLAATAVDNLRSSGKKIASEARIKNLQRDGSDGHPVGETLGLIADFAHASGEILEEDGTRMATAFIASIAANVSSKTFLQGVVEFMDGMAGGEPFKVQNFITNMATSFIPNVIRQTNPDDTVRETRGVFDEIVGRTPWSAGLEPQRNLFGEPVLRAPGYLNRTFNPFTVTQKSDDPTVADELVALGRAMTMPAEERLGGAVNLTDREKWFNPKTTAAERGNQSPYDRMLEIMANPGNGVPSLKDVLSRTIKSDAWANISDGTAAQPGGEKYKIASQIVGQYQDMALARVKGEYPELARALATEDAERAAAALQGEAGVAAVRSLFQPK